MRSQFLWLLPGCVAAVVSIGGISWGALFSVSSAGMLFFTAKKIKHASDGDRHCADGLSYFIANTLLFLAIGIGYGRVIIFGGNDR